MLEKTLVILKPCTIQRALIGEVINRFERKGLRLAGMKMVQLTDEILSEHYAHLSEKPFFQRVKDAMMVPYSYIPPLPPYTRKLSIKCTTAYEEVDIVLPLKRMSRVITLYVLFSLSGSALIT